MVEDATIYKNNAMALMRIMASLGLASDSLIGNAANALMYQAGKDMGKTEGKKLDKTNDLAKALEMLMHAEEGVWFAELWKDQGQNDFVIQNNGISSACVIFRECPIRQVCLSHGTKMDGVICRITHGLFAGMLGEVMNKKVDLKVEHAGPNACKKILEIREPANGAS
jgi:predicted hydrocarbon binding protein